MTRTFDRGSPRIVDSCDCVRYTPWVDCQGSPVAAQASATHPWVQRRVDLAFGSVGLLQDHIPPSANPFATSPGDIDRRSDPVPAVMDKRCVHLERFRFVRWWRQDVEVHFDRLHGIPCLAGGFGGHRGDGLAFKTAAGLKKFTPDVVGIGPPEIRLGARSRQDGVHAGHLFGRVCIDAFDDGIGVGDLRTAP